MTRVKGGFVRFPCLIFGTLSLLAITTSAGASVDRAGNEAPTAHEGASLPKQELQLLEFLAQVHIHHPKLLASQYKVSAADAEIISTRGAFDWKLHASGSHYPLGKYQRTRGEIGLKKPTAIWGAELSAKYENGADFAPYDGGRTTSEWGKVTLGLLLPILQGGATDSRRYEVVRSKLEGEIAKHAVRQTRSDLLADAAHSWWKWTISGHKVRIYDELLRQAEERRAMLDDLVEAGLVAPLEAIDNQRTVLTRDAQRAALFAQYRAAAIKLALYYRDAEGNPQAASNFDVPDLGHLADHLEVNGAFEVSIDQLDRELDQTPLAAVYSTTLDLIRQELRLANNQQLPRLDLSLSASHAAGQPRPYGPDTYSVTQTTFGGNLELGLDVQRRKSRGKAKALRAKLSQVEQELRLAKDVMRADILASQQALSAQYQVVLQSRQATELARRLARLELEALVAGQSTVMNVNLREQAVLTAQLTELEALHELQAAWIEMQRTRGQTEPRAFVLPGLHRTQDGARSAR